MRIKGKDIKKARHIFRNFKTIIDRINDNNIDEIERFLIKDGCPNERSANYISRLNNFKKFYECEINTRIVFKYWEYFYEDNLKKCPAPHDFIKKVCFDNNIEYDFVELFYVVK